MDKVTVTDILQMNNYFTSCLHKYGPNDAKALSWFGEDTQLVRYKILTEIADLNNKKILDVGCGLGDYWGYLKTNQIKPKKYSGIDINENLIYEARIKYNISHFQSGIIDKIIENFDFIIACGLFGYRIENYQEKYFEMIKKMFSLSKIGLGFNMLNKNCENQEELCAYFEVLEVENFVKTLTPKVKIIKDYLPNDFTVFVYK